MTHINAPSRRNTVLALAMVAALLFSGWAVPAGPGALAAPKDDATEEFPFVFRWDAPTDATGTFAATIIVAPDGEARCEGSVSATGTFNASNPIAYWEAGRLGHYAGHWRHPVQAHAGPADTRLLTATQGGSWHKVGGLSKTVVQDGRTLDISVAAFDLLHRPDSGFESPLTIKVGCDVPIDVELEAGRHARSFTPDSLEGGVGVSDNLLQGRILAGGDRLVENFETPVVRFQVTQMVTPPSDRDGTLTLDHPGGFETWTWDPAGPKDIDLDGGPGRYEAKLDWSSSWSDALYGTIMGLEPVESLDEVFG